MIEQLKNKSPFAQILILLVIGIVALVLLSILFSVLVAFLYPEITTLSAQNQMRNFPVQYMIGNYLPFQIGLFLVPSLLYAIYKKRTGQVISRSKTIHLYLWSFALFATLFFLLPFLTAINSFVLDSFNMLQAVEEESLAITKSLNFLIGPLASKESFWVALLIIGILVPICEELFFRAFILTHIANTKESNWLGILISALVFTLLHFNWYQFVPILCFGIALGLIYVITRSVLPGIILHALNNSINVIWVRYDNMPNVVETYQPSTSAIFILLLIVLLAVYHKRLALK